MTGWGDVAQRDFIPVGRCLAVFCLRSSIQVEPDSGERDTRKAGARDVPRMRRPTRATTWRDERGFTLPELLVTIAILGILLAIAIIVWLGLLESRRVDAATNQLKADMRVAHTRATNQLTDWRVVLVLDNDEEGEGPDYYLVKLAAPYPGAPPQPVERVPRTFPGDVVAKIPETPSGVITDDQAAAFWVAPWDSPPTPVAPRTRTVEFNTDGAMSWYGSAGGSACVTVDGKPNNRVYAQSATSRIRAKPDGACELKPSDP